jgi:hypothetical protein
MLIPIKMDGSLLMIAYHSQEISAAANIPKKQKKNADKEENGEL